MEFTRLFLKCYGIYEWLIVRLSAILVSLYIIYIFGMILSFNNLSYEEWYNFFEKKLTKFFNIIALLSVLSHTWIGMKHILEDYVKSIKLRKFGMVIIYMMLYIYSSLGIIIIWGI